MQNPFKLVNDLSLKSNGSINKPYFKPEKIITAKLSNEAYQGIINLANRYAENNITKLIELLGLYQLQISIRTNTKDTQSNATTDECRQAGFEDATEGHPARFLALFSNTSNVFEEAYMQGYLEGASLKNSD